MNNNQNCHLDNLKIANTVDKNIEYEKWATYIAEQEKEKQTIQQHIHHLKQHEKNLQSEIFAIKNSISWKITSPLRKSLKNYPQIRLCLRKILKFIWWLTSLQLPKKIKERYKSTLKTANKSLAQSTEISYQMWIKQNDTFSKKDLQKIAHHIVNLPNKPLISIIMPTYNTDPRFLKAAIESVLNQIYTHWELCIADDCSTRTDTKALLKKYAEKDKRIKVTFRSENGNISETSNTALQSATGEYAALMDHDDILPPHALAFIIESINKNPHAKIIYSDEDIVDEGGKRIMHYFKPDWNYDLFLNQNFVNHFSVYNMQLIKEVNGFRKKFDGCQDYDLTMRCIEKISPKNIIHIPYILYHWRAAPGSLALGPEQKEYVYIKAKDVVQEHFDRLNIKAVSLSSSKFQHLPPEDLPLVSIIIEMKSNFHILKNTVLNVLNSTSYNPYEIIVITNNKENFDLGANKLPNCHFIYEESLNNTASKKNAAVKYAKGKILAFIEDSATSFSAEWLMEMTSHAMRPTVGVVGSKIISNEDTILHAGIIGGLYGSIGHIYSSMPLSTLGYYSRLHLTQNFMMVSDTCCLIRKDLFLDLQGFSDKEFPNNYYIMDFCLRAFQNGLLNVWTPHAQMTIEANSYEKSLKIHHDFNETNLFVKRWGHLLENDPHYNPNFTHDLLDCSLAKTSRAKKFWNNSTTV